MIQQEVQNVEENQEAKGLEMAQKEEENQAEVSRKSSRSSVRQAEPSKSE